MLNVTNVQYHTVVLHAECRYAECCYAECRGVVADPSGAPMTCSWLEFAPKY
jgi:hypothetical protein